MTKRFPWDGDNVVAGGKTSITVVLEWLGGAGNYDRWRTAQSARGLSTSSDGTTLGPHVYKIELAREILRELAAHGITHRLARDVRWKINTFCRSYAAAALYLREYEQLKPEQLRKTIAANAIDAQRLMDANEQRVMTHVYNLCPYFDVLDPIMKDDLVNLQAAEQERKRKKVNAQEKKFRASSDDDDGDENDEEGGSRHTLSEDESPFGSFIEQERTRHNGFTGSRNGNGKRRSPGGSLDDGEAELQEKKNQQLCFKKRKRELLLENLAFDNELKRIKIKREGLKLAKQIALGRKQMLDAGIPLSQVNALFPLQSLEPDTERERKQGNWVQTSTDSSLSTSPSDRTECSKGRLEDRQSWVRQVLRRR